MTDNIVIEVNKPLYDLQQVVTPIGLSSCKCRVIQRSINIDTGIWSYTVEFINHRLSNTIYPETRLKEVK